MRFYRNSIAFASNSQVVINQPRHEIGKYGQAIKIEEGTTNLISLANQKFVGWTPYSGATVVLTQNQSVPEWGATDATRIQTSGGTNVLKYYISIVNPTVNGTPYTYSLYVKNQGLTVVSIGNNFSWSNINPGELKKIIMTCTGNGTTVLQLKFQVASASDSLDIIAWQPQVEAKAYKTSWFDTTRVAETLTIPNTTFNKSDWCVEFTPRPTSAQIVTGKTGFLWENYIDANNYYAVKVDANGRAYLEVNSGGTIYTASSASIPQMVVDTDYPIAVKGNGSLMAIFVNHTKYAEVSYVEPVGTLPTNSYLGSDHNGANHANANYDELRVSKYRQDSDLATIKNIPLEWDMYTILKFPCPAGKPTFYRTDQAIRKLLWW